MLSEEPDSRPTWATSHLRHYEKNRILDPPSNAGNHQNPRPCRYNPIPPTFEPDSQGMLPPGIPRKTPSEIQQAFLEIRNSLLAQSEAIKHPNFEALSTGDLALLFSAYDERFFHGLLEKLLNDRTSLPLRLRLSSRMTSSGGKTTVKQWRDIKSGQLGEISYEIAISTTLLFLSFRDVQRPIQVCGVTCRDRLDALQRLMEHEITHLLEYLLREESSCNKTPFKFLAATIFGHTDTRHQLISQKERAATQFGIRRGSWVRFLYEGQPMEGRVNRITKRATILVPSKTGTLYSDGRKYSNFYIPLGLLDPADPPPSEPR